MLKGADETADVLKLGDKAADAVKAGDNAVDAATRASDIHKAVPKATQGRTTIAVTETAEGRRIVSSSENRLRAEQRKMLQSGVVEGAGKGHAEVTGISTAKGQGLTPTAVAASRPICPSWAETLRRNGIELLSPIKEVQ